MRFHKFSVGVHVLLKKMFSLVLDGLIYISCTSNSSNFHDINELENAFPKTMNIYIYAGYSIFLNKPKNYVS